MRLKTYLDTMAIHKNQLKDDLSCSTMFIHYQELLVSIVIKNSWSFLSTCVNVSESYTNRTR